jgi:hypothetical protein
MASIVSKRSATGKIKLIDRVREAIRGKHYAVRTEQTDFCRNYSARILQNNSFRTNNKKRSLVTKGNLCY